MMPALRFSPYQKKLLVFLSVATFFEGYDFIALTQLLPNIRADFDLSVAASGRIVAFVNLGTIAAYVLVRRADQVGRRRLLSITIVGYAIATAASGFAYSPWDFAFFQFVARIFLIAEWATSMVLAAEEFPAERRGMVIGIIQAASSFGAIVCAGVVPLLLKTPWGWRTVYFVGIVPLALLAFARRDLRESARFAATAPSLAKRPLGFVFRTPYRTRVFKLAIIWGLTYVCTQNAITFFKEFVVLERGFSDAEEALAITIAAVGSLPMLFFVGKLIDWLGRKGAAWVLFPTLTASVIGCYCFSNRLLLTIALTFAIFSVSAVLPVLNAFTTELFPTELRGDSFAWANNILGRIPYVISPLVLTAVAERVGFSTPMTIAALFPLVALVLIWRWLPETRGRELEETALLEKG